MWTDLGGEIEAKGAVKGGFGGKQEPKWLPNPPQNRAEARRNTNNHRNHENGGSPSNILGVILRHFWLFFVKKSIFVRSCGAPAPRSLFSSVLERSGELRHP